MTKFTEDQAAIYKIVMEAVSQKQSLWTFIDVSDIIMINSSLFICIVISYYEQ